ncbi:hypothetical protein HXX76_007576 [Chlamydomonas incerta]|uniref:Protein kinase domain-containing protein n=1 Tax=Chlamydomonas incerta TaxID=51695 RepID=A0A835T950_CHLIN|nr:hypothetical protein HXX76_007576 [Chlamydomonas incerta]|eukprot:KAG2434685.1 hypothetical protein HXX76_007576 [Chlamydomonas incerta]
MPPQLPPGNMWEVPVPLPSPPGVCKNVTDALTPEADPSVHLLDRCYALAGRCLITSLYGADLQPVTGNAVKNGYLVHMLRVNFFCPEVLSSECITARGPLGCGTLWHSQNRMTWLDGTSSGAVSSTDRDSPPPPPLTPPLLTPGGSGQGQGQGQGGNTAVSSELKNGSGGGGDSAGVPVAAIAAIAGGGLALLAVGITAALLWRRRRQGGDGAGADGGMCAKEETTAAAGDTNDDRLTSETAEANNCGLRIYMGSNEGAAPANTAATTTTTATVPSTPRAAAEAASPAAATTTAATASQVIGVSGGLASAGASAAATSGGTAGVGGGGCRARTEYIAAANGTGSCDLTEQATHATAAADDSGGAAQSAASADASASAAAGSSSSGGSNEVKLLPITLGKGTFGRVVVGEFRGLRVAVKLVNLNLAAWEPPPLPAAAAIAAGGADTAAASIPATAGRSGPADAAAADAACGGGTLAILAGGSGTGPTRAMPPVPAAPPPPAKAKAAGAPQGPLTAARNKATGLQKSFIAEVEVLARIQHPNIVQLLAACIEPPQMCLVIELMDTSLERLLYGGGPSGGPRPFMPLGKVLHVAIQVCEALAYLHPTIIHRDLKPGNVLISNPNSDTPIVKLADFGLSKLQTTVQFTWHADAGTAAYMAPETLNPYNHAVMHHVDMYAVGVMLWEMLAGQRPWAGLSIAQIAYSVGLLKQRPPLDGAAMPPGRCPPKLRALVQACWDQDPKRRPAASEVLKELTLLRFKIAQQSVPAYA